MYISLDIALFLLALIASITVINIRDTKYSFKGLIFGIANAYLAGYLIYDFLNHSILTNTIILLSKVVMLLLASLFGLAGYLYIAEFIKGKDTELRKWIESKLKD